MDTTNKLAEAERRLSDFLSQFEHDVQERLLRYALDHIVPRLKGAKSDTAQATQAVSGPVATQPTALEDEPFAHLVVINTDAGPTKFFTAPRDPRGFPVYRKKEQQ